MSRAASAPSTRDIFGVPNPYAGNPVQPGNRTMGLGGPQVAGINWEPRGADGRFQKGPANFLRYGQAPVEHGHIELSTAPITYQYLCPPLNDRADLLLMPDMLVFGVNQMDPEESSNILLSLSKVNCLMQMQKDDFDLQRNPGIDGTLERPTSPHFNSEAYEFYQWLTEYGERGLEDYAYAESHNQKARLEAFDRATNGQLKRFWQLSTSSEFCWLTTYGILKRISFLGVIITSNRAHGLEAADTTEHHDHYMQVTVGIGKRVRCAQLFGDNSDITTGSKVWITLSRKHLGQGKYGAFQLRPGGSKKVDYPLPTEMSYLDEAGQLQTGHHWPVGVVIEPSNSNPQPYNVEAANNTGYEVSESNAYGAHASIATCYVAIGY